ncbi:clustered mitochondria protein homolog [Octopus sinensis]|uniref:Clustered mitochondria protein homolog n=1 Tax=Octopus sinensis TaxID=2607531 RepID=A0A6P7TFD9_9MOLL|nr:clustered mitochondria protein homolog [Octopus sinensis]
MAGISAVDDNNHVEKESQTSTKTESEQAGNANNVVVNGCHDDKEAMQNSEECKTAKDTEEKMSSEKDPSEKDSVPATNENEKNNEQEIVLIQDTGFTVKIVCPGTEPFDLTVSCMELVQEIHQVLMDREDTCHKTCFSLQCDGVTLDNFAELKTIENLKDNSVIKVVEEPYTVREARIHVRHVRDLLKSVDQNDAYIGIDCNSLTCLNAVFSETHDRKNRSRLESTDCSPPEFILPNSKEPPLLYLHPSIKEQKGPQCLKVMTYSGWNPPPGNRRMHGDLLYLHIVTLEDKRFHVTASTRGFYLNQCTEDEFNPKVAAQKHLSHSLIELLNQISPSFKRNFAILLKKRAQKHPFERVPTPYQVYSWVSPQMEHTIDYIRAEDAFSTRLGYEEHIPGQTRDWNEEIQTTRELSRKTLPDRLIRERAIFKVNSDFVSAATRGAMAVIDGNVMAINPGEDAKMQMFIWNNIFFSLGFDVRDHYKDFGGDAAAYAAPGNDLQGVKAYFGIDPEGLYMLGTIVVDYRGYRITGQSIIPGILERDQEQSVVYGSVDFGKTVVSNPKYEELLKKTALALKIQPHKVVNSKDEEIELYSSVECKGIIGNDQRHYVLDLLRTFPPDVNFLPVDENELSKELRSYGFPRPHKHKLACLRQELTEAFVENRHMIFVRNAALEFKAKREKSDKQSEDKKQANSVIKTDSITEESATDVVKKIVEALNGNNETFVENGKEIIKKAASSVGSLSDSEFSIAFNPDVFQPHVNHTEADTHQLEKEKQLVKDAAEFLVLHHIPSFVNDCLDHTTSIIDGTSLTDAMHHRGINIRYLGCVADTISKCPQISYLYTIAVAELVCLSAKHTFKAYMQGVAQMHLSSSLSHFLNCFLGSFQSPNAQVAIEDLQKNSRKKNKRKNKSGILYVPDNTEWLNETPKSLWKRIVNDVHEYYHFTVESDSVDSLVEKYGIQKISLLRSICRKCGIQILLKDYNFDSKNRQTFFEDDIVNVFPVIKCVHPKASDAYHFFTSGQSKIQQGLLREGYDLISEALNLLNNVYGAMHPDIAACLRLLARLNYIMGEYSEALSYQQRAVLMSERVLGIDNANTITEYAHLALYCFANNQIANALKLIYRARYLALICHGENHPEVALFDSNIGLILHAAEEYDLSLRFLEKALELNIKFYGAKSLKVAMGHHLVARTRSCRSDFRSALQSEKEAYAIYKQVLGEEHERTKESSECLKHLTQQAVVFQKKMNEICKGEKSINFAPLQIQTPSIQSVLDTLNVINGIVFVQISPEDIERFRLEMLKRSQLGTNADSSELLKNGVAEDLESGNEVKKEKSEDITGLTNGNLDCSHLTKEVLITEG